MANPEMNVIFLEKISADDSIPICSIMKNRERRLMAESSDVGVMKPKTAGPIITPAIIAPTTSGRPRTLNTEPRAIATTRRRRIRGIKSVKGPLPLIDYWQTGI